MNATDKKLYDTIASLVKRNQRSGLSISYLMECLREQGWKNLGRRGQFDDTVERLGFKLRHQDVGTRGGVRTFVEIRQDLHRQTRPAWTTDLDSRATRSFDNLPTWKQHRIMDQSGDPLLFRWWGYRHEGREFVQNVIRNK